MTTERPPDRAVQSAPVPTAGLSILFGVTVVVATCSIVYELVLAQTLAVLTGNAVLRYSITIGCYLGALGVGAMLCARGRGSIGARLFRVELALSVAGGLSVLAFLVIDALHRYWYMTQVPGEGTVGGWVALGVTHSIIVLIGVLSGFEIPLLIRLGEERRAGSTNLVLGVDYAGSLVGSVLFPVVFLRELGLLGTAFAIGTLNAIAAAAVCLWLPMPHRGRRLTAAGLVAAALIFAWTRAEALELHFARKFYAYGTE